MDRQPPKRATANRAFSAVEAAALLGVSQRTIRRAIANGALPAVKQNGAYRIERVTLDRYARETTLSHRVPASRDTGAVAPVRFDFVRPRTRLIGRTQEIAELSAALVDTPASLITLTGPGGVGKTRLALEAAAQVEREFPDGVHWVALAPVRDAELVASAIAQSFGLQGGTSADAVDRIVRAVGDQRVLLVLDNLEHVVAAAPAISRIFHFCPRLTVLCTSRSPLRISDEVDYAVSPLMVSRPLGTGSFEDQSFADALQLFELRARAAKRDFAVTPDNIGCIADICARLDGLPLAIELAATRIRELSPAALLARLDPRLPLLTGGPRDRPSHQQTVRDTIAWSYNLLSTDDQLLLRQLSVFVGGCSPAASEAVAQSPAVLEGIASLIGQSLLQQTTDGLGEIRYAMLETVREYGLELLSATAEEARTRARHADWMLDYAMQAGAAWVRTDYALWIDRLEVERGNLRAALAWANDTGQAELALGLAIESNRFWRTRGPSSEGVNWLERALSLDANAPKELRVRALEFSADLATVSGNLDLALLRANEGERMARAFGPPWQLDLILSVKARILFLTGEPESAIPLLEEALALATTHGYKAGIASDLSNLGVARRMIGDPERAVPLLEAGFALASEIGLTYVASTVIMCLADAWRDLGEKDRAEALYRDGLRNAIDQHEWRNAAIAISGLAALTAAEGHNKRTARLCGAAAALLDQVGAAMTPGGQESYGRAVHAARAALGDALFEREWNAGRALSPQAVLFDESTESQVRRDGLTRRELEVLRLLADGRSNREIADMLFISLRTVTNHVAGIFAKLDVPSRSAAISYAFRNGLV